MFNIENGTLRDLSASSEISAAVSFRTLQCTAICFVTLVSCHPQPSASVHCHPLLFASVHCCPQPSASGHCDPQKPSASVHCHEEMLWFSLFSVFIDMTLHPLRRLSIVYHQVSPSVLEVSSIRVLWIWTSVDHLRSPSESSCLFRDLLKI